MPKTTVVDRHSHPKYPRLSVQLRSDSRFYQAVTYIDGRLRQVSTKTGDFRTALKLAEDWYRKLLRASVSVGRQHPIERLTADPTMAELFSRYRATLPGSTQKTWSDWRWGPIADFWRTKMLREVGPQTIREFYAWRRKRTKGIKANTLHKDVVLIRQVLKHAIESELLDHLPAIPKPGPMHANPRPWLTRQEWDHLMKVSETRMTEAINNDRLFAQRVDTHEFAQLMVTTMCRVGEVLALRYRDCRFERRTGSRGEMLIAEVTGKRGTRTIVAPREAAKIIKQRRARVAKNANADDQLVFPEHHRDAFRELLKAAGLRRDGRGFPRNLKSLRATAISLRLLAAGATANLLMIARAAGTSVQMIDQFYAKRLSAELFKDDLATTVVEIES